MITCCLVCRFAPFCSELCLQTPTIRLRQAQFWHVVVMKRRAWRKTTEALDSNITTRWLKIQLNVQNTEFTSVNGSNVSRDVSQNLFIDYKLIYSVSFYVTEDIKDIVGVPQLSVDVDMNRQAR